MKERTSSFVFTLDPNSAVDAEKLSVVKATVKSINSQLRMTYKYAVSRAKYFGQAEPQKPTLKRVRLMGRGPRVQHAMNDYGYRRAYDSYLPQRHATRLDVYIADCK